MSSPCDQSSRDPSSCDPSSCDPSSCDPTDPSSRDTRRCPYLELPASIIFVCFLFFRAKG